MKKTLILLLTIIPAFTSFANSDKSEDLADLQKSDAKSIDVTYDFIIDVSANGELSAEGEKLTTELLRKRLENELATNKDLKVLLRSSSKVEHQKAVHLIDLCKKAGVNQIAIATQK